MVRGQTRTPSESTRGSGCSQATPKDPKFPEHSQRLQCVSDQMGPLPPSPRLTDPQAPQVLLLLIFRLDPPCVHVQHAWTEILHWASVPPRFLRPQQISLLQRCVLIQSELKEANSSFLLRHWADRWCRLVSIEAAIPVPVYNLD